MSENTGSVCTADQSLVDAGLESFRAVAVQRAIADHTGVLVPLREFLGEACAADLARYIRAHEGDQVPDRAAAVGEGAPVRADGSFALTPVQTSYWIGRGPDYPLGGVSTHFYFEFDRTVTDGSPDDEITALEHSWNVVVDRHPMLRAVVRRDGLQQVLDAPGVHRIDVRDLRGLDADDRGALLEEYRRDLSHRCAPVHRWPVHAVTALVFDDRTIRLCLSFDVLLMDFTSWRLVIDEWGVAHRGGDLPPAPAADFAGLLAEQARRRAADGRRDRDLAYWSDRASTLPDAARLPTLRTAAEIGVPHFRRHRRVIDAAVWESFSAACARRGLTASGAMLAVFGDVLRRWGAGDRFTVTITLFDRPADLPHAAAVVGDFTTTALVDMTCDATAFADRAAAVAANFWDAVDHSSVAGVEVARLAADRPALPGDDGPGGAVVFTSALEQTPRSEDPGAWIGDEAFGVSQTPQVLLDAISWRSGENVVVAWDAVEDAFGAGVVDGMQRAFVSAIELLGAADAAWTSASFDADPFFRPVADRLRNNTAVDGPGLAAPLLHAADERPDRAAVLTESGVLDYRGLVDGARSIAARLDAAREADGRAHDGTVLVALPKGPAQICAVLGVLMAGGVYVPVDPAWPAPRIARVVERSGARYAVADDVELPPSVTRIEPDGGARTGAFVTHRPAPDDLAYAIFTSGSTGEPKGVAIEHDQARTTIDDVNERFGVGPDDRVLGLSALSFDLSVWDVFGVLGAGGGLVVPTPGRDRDPGHWLDLIAQHRVTVWNTAPQLMEMLVEYGEAVGDSAHALRSIRLVLLSGDWIPVTLPDRIRALMPDAEIVSLGGATEASIWSIHHRIGAVDPGAPSIPYGTALSGQWFRLLDEPDGRPVPVGEPGELFIGGDGVARGYLGDPEQTARRFRRHPVTGERLYHTGDMGRWRVDGAIEFLGRNDRQVKINGFRIELGEIDAVLSRHPGVRAAVATTHPGPDGRPRLVAHVVGHTANTVDLDPDDLRAHCDAALPAYMVPRTIEIRSELPVTANGKIDHAALAPTRDAPGSATAHRPATSAPPSSSQSSWPQSSSSRPPARTRVDAAAVAAIVGDRFPTDRPLLSAGADSMILVRLANLIEDTTGRRPGFAELAAASVADLTDRADLPRPSDHVAGPAPAERTPEPEEPEATGAALDAGLPLDARLPLDVVVRTDSGHRSAADLLIDAGTWIRAVDRRAGRLGVQVRTEFSDVPGQLCRVELRPGAPRRVEKPRALTIDADTATHPLTDMQLAYYVGRADRGLGAPVAPHYYSEIDVDGVDLDRLRGACRRLVEIHPMLRAYATADAAQRLAAVDDVPDLDVRDLRDLSAPRQEAVLARTRSERSRRVRDVLAPGWFSVTASLLDDRTTRLHVELDMLFCDVAGAVTLAEDLYTLYRGGDVEPPAARFLDWADEHPARAGTAGRPVTVVEPRLPMRRPDDTVFDRRRTVLSASRTRRLESYARTLGTTVDALLVTLYADALRAASGGSDAFSIVLTVLDRPTEHRRVVGEYSSTIVATPPAVGGLAERSASTAEQLFAALDRPSGRSAPRIDSSGRAGAVPVLPIAYSSGITASRDASELLAAFGRTVYSISQTPQVLIDMQTFVGDGALVVNWDAITSAFVDGFVDEAFADFARRLDAVANERVPDEPAPAAPSAVLRTVTDLRRGRRPIAAAPSDPAVRSVIRETLAQVLDVDAGGLDADRSFFDLGATSLDLVALRNELVDRSVGDLTVLDLFETGSIAALADRLHPPRPAPFSEELAIPAPSPSSTAASHASVDPLARAHARGSLRRRGGLR
ncbi:amino acid adenylation domain-containing protein [Gordonia humi]|uniref:Phenyloxazoline synthase MbtB n=1 Tax=Gordonia humi TaxID=686429 RepID=A0A840F1D7_9ACTN|nr:amino acid adenylation domain-containing protein [Gordonia humi]